MSRTLLAVVVSGILFTASSCNLYHAIGGRWKGRSVPTQVTDTARRDSTAIAVDTNVSVKDTTVHIPAPVVDSARAALTQLWAPVWAAEFQFSTFSGKARAHYESSADNEDFTANIRVERDKKIWISVTALGLFEAARVLITPDTVIAIDRIHKEVRIVPFTDAGKLLPTGVAANFKALQSLILGSVIPAGGQPLNVEDSGSIMIIQTLAQGTAQTVHFNASDSSLLSQSVVSGDASLNADYADYQIVDGRRFSNTRNLLIQIRGERSSLKLEFGKVSFDQPVEMNFQVPEKYQRK